MDWGLSLGKRLSDEIKEAIVFEKTIHKNRIDIVIGDESEFLIELKYSLWDNNSIKAGTSRSSFPYDFIADIVNLKETQKQHSAKCYCLCLTNAENFKTNISEKLQEIENITVINWQLIDYTNSDKKYPLYLLIIKF